MKANIFNSDDSLIRERLKQRDLLVSERTDLSAANKNRSDGYSLAQQRRCQGRASTGHGLNVFAAGKFALHFYGHVTNVDGLLIDNSSARNPVAIYSGFFPYEMRWIGGYAATRLIMLPSTR